MKQINYKIEDFEGPLDLLLVLISKNKMNILDIEILTIVSQYLKIIENAREQDLDIASDFIDMAARLIYLKSVYLLPKNEEGEKLRQELQGQLIEYSQAKIASELLRNAFVGDSIFVREAQEFEIDLTYNNIHPVEDLINAYKQLSDRALSKAPPKIEKFETIVTAPVVSVQSKIFSLLKNLMRNNFKNIKFAFSNIKSRSEAVATFLAILELLRAQRMNIKEDGELVLKTKTKR